MSVTPLTENPIVDLIPEIELALDDALAPEAGFPDRLQEAMRYSLLAPGKRLRPALVLMSAEACGAGRRDAMPAAVAIEMIHAYSLIHDDLPAMDDDTTRRGRPTCHIQFDEATAILAGDALIPAAFEILSTGITKPNLALRACQLLSKAAGRAALVGGQMDDLLAETRKDEHNERWLRAIHARKTGALFTCALQLGATCADATEVHFEAVTNYAKALGLAFQIVDDLLDHSGDGEQMGKESGKDAARGKLTFPGLVGEARSREMAAEYIATAKSHADQFGHSGARLGQLADYVLQRSS